MINSKTKVTNLADRSSIHIVLRVQSSAVNCITYLYYILF